jgi:hypothetical protein
VLPGEEISASCCEKHRTFDLFASNVDCKTEKQAISNGILYMKAQFKASECAENIGMHKSGN